MRDILSFAASARTDAVRVTHADRSAFLADIDRHLAQRNGFTLATVNLDHVVKLRRDPQFRAAYLAHSHVVADGNPIVWLSRLAGRPVDLMPGSELITPLADLAARHDVPVACVGSTPDALEMAADRLEAQHPGLTVVTRLSPAFGFDPDGAEADAIIDQIKNDGARLCFVALGAPKQERFAVRLQTAAPSCGVASIGAGLDFIAGNQVRAPQWARAIAMEWAWRLLSNPKRLLGRYAGCFAILPGLSLAALATRWRGA